MSLKFFWVGILLSILTFEAQARPVPVFLRDGSSRFLSRSLGSACYTMDSVQRGLPCNPAAIAKERKSRFDMDLFLGSNLGYIKEAKDLLSGNASEEEVAKFFSRRSSTDAEASIELSYQQSTWGISFEPYRILAITRFENPALPMVDLVVAQEQNAKLQLASYMDNNFYAGIQARYTHVKFIGNYFALSEVVGSGADEVLATRTQDLLYLEPGLLYVWEDVEWKPQISAVLTNWGYTSEKTEQYPIRPEGLLGTSIRPMVPHGNLELGVQLSLNSETKNARDALRFSGAYQLGFLQFVATLAEYDRSAGLMYSFRGLTSGLAYWDQDESRGIYLHWGVSF